MFRFNLKCETSQLTDIEPSLLVNNTILYLKKDYKILERTDNKISFAFNNSSALGWRSELNRLRIIHNGKLKVIDGEIRLTYYIDVLIYVLFIVIGLFLCVISDYRAIIISIIPSVEWLSKIRALKKTSRSMLMCITGNSSQQITIKYKSIGREKV